jgi:hypothetical protein
MEVHLSADVQAKLDQTRARQRSPSDQFRGRGSALDGADGCSTASDRAAIRIGSHET